MNQTPSKQRLSVLLAAPRGFCAGVERAIQVVELALERYGAPVYVRHEIVHNRYVVDRLRGKGAIFVEETDEVPEGFPVIFSAHGVPKAVPEQARRRHLVSIDATCPLVSKVHAEAAQRHRAGYEIVLIGHAGHPEVIGTMGQLPERAIRLVETIADAETMTPDNPERLAYVTQTTLSVKDTAEIVAALKRRFPDIIGPHKDDICYATTNRQEAVREIAPRCDALIVVGSPNSSNSRRLVEVGRRAGCGRATLCQRGSDLDLDSLDGIRTLGVTAGASAPEALVDELLDRLRTRYDLVVEEVRTTSESVRFKLPRVLSPA
jgi:4-hydroxy-3-methylbut-2-enyl diphosphate reductase